MALTLIYAYWFFALAILLPCFFELCADTADWLAEYLDSHPSVLAFLTRNR